MNKSSRNVQQGTSGKTLRLRVCSLFLPRACQRDETLMFCFVQNALGELAASTVRMFSNN
jgi:hypothetical protein